MGQMHWVAATAAAVVWASSAAGQVSLTATPFLGPAPLKVTFDAGAADDARYVWDFGEPGGRAGAVGRQANHTFRTPGEYTVTLIVVHEAGGVERSEIVVTVAPETRGEATPLTGNEARRFLWQAAFGPTPASIDAVKSRGYEAWLDAQRALPPTLMPPEYLATSIARGYGYSPATIWDDVCIEAPDQLRQRMAWALLQVLVMNNPQDTASADMSYYSGYIQRALGNYRDLLGFVTRSHQMGVFLTYINNSRYDPSTGAMPDENYARELMQLFSIGLVRLNRDGTPLLDGAGQPIPTFDNATVGQFARVFTGFRWGADFGCPMPMQVDRHEFGAKQLLNYAGAVPPGGLIPATNVHTEARAQADIDAALDNVFHHPNCAPFVSTLLIKRLVTSNPTPAYVERVARAFEGHGPHGSGVRGDLFATAKAILLDREAREPAYRTNPLYGKVVEPLVTRWGLYRILQRVDRPAEVFPFRINSDTYQLQLDLGQAFLESPSVFNFYLPDYIPPLTELAPRRMYAPELQIYNDFTALATQNRFHDELITRGGTTESGRYAAWRALSGSPRMLVAALNDELMAGALSPESAKVIETALSRISGSTDRVRTGVWLIVNSPEFRVLK